MNRLVAWLKARARAWAAPDYERISASDEAAHVKLYETRGQLAAVQAALKNANAMVASYQAAQQRRPTEWETVEHDEPQWTPDDSDTWRHFLATNGAGRKLQELANFHEQACNRNAILRKEGAENNTGFARGWHMATAYFFKTLSAEVRPEQDPNDTQQGDSASRLRERVAP